MKKLNVKTHNSYNIYIDDSILGSFGSLARTEVGGRNALVITDENAGIRYASIAISSLNMNGYKTKLFVLPTDRLAKSYENYIDIINFLAKNDFQKSDVVFALGGGSVGDLAGFAASTYMRGIKYVQLPTTLLSQVDSAIGGKTAIDVPEGKNMAGSFLNPSLVICDPILLATLDEKELKNGYAEILKYGILTDPEMPGFLKSAMAIGDYKEVVYRCLAIKKYVIEQDEKDLDQRQYLNFGHLIGHALEVHSSYSLPHGEAVALGIALETKAASMSGFTHFSTFAKITKLLEDFNFETSFDISKSDLKSLVHKDKRIRDGKINLIIPDKIGKCFMRQVNLEALDRFIASAL